MRRRRHGPGPESGAVTAEAAVVIPVLVVLAAVLAWLVCLGVAQVRVVDAAREAARSAARGDPMPDARSLARKVAPRGATVDITRGGGEVVATVRSTVEGPGGMFEFLPAFHVHARAVTVSEDPG